MTGGDGDAQASSLSMRGVAHDNIASAAQNNIAKSSRILISAAVRLPTVTMNIAKAADPGITIDFDRNSVDGLFSSDDSESVPATATSDDELSDAPTVDDHPSPTNYQSSSSSLHLSSPELSSSTRSRQQEPSIFLRPSVVKRKALSPLKKPVCSLKIDLNIPPPASADAPATTLIDVAPSPVGQVASPVSPVIEDVSPVKKPSFNFWEPPPPDPDDDYFNASPAKLMGGRKTGSESLQLHSAVSELDWSLNSSLHRNQQRRPFGSSPPPSQPPQQFQQQQIYQQQQPFHQQGPFQQPGPFQQHPQQSFQPQPLYQQHHQPLHGYSEGPYQHQYRPGPSPQWQGQQPVPYMQPRFPQQFGPTPQFGLAQQFGPPTQSYPRAAYPNAHWRPPPSQWMPPPRPIQQQYPAPYQQMPQQPYYQQSMAQQPYYAQQPHGYGQPLMGPQYPPQHLWNPQPAPERRRKKNENRPPGLTKKDLFEEPVQFPSATPPASVQETPAAQNASKISPPRRPQPSPAQEAPESTEQPESPRSNTPASPLMCPAPNRQAPPPPPPKFFPPQPHYDVPVIEYDCDNTDGENKPDSPPAKSSRRAASDDLDHRPSKKLRRAAARYEEDEDDEYEPEPPPREQTYGKTESTDLTEQTNKPVKIPEPDPTHHCASFWKRKFCRQCKVNGNGGENICEHYNVGYMCFTCHYMGRNAAAICKVHNMALCRCGCRRKGEKGYRGAARRKVRERKALPRAAAARIGYGGGGGSDSEEFSEGDYSDY